MMSKIRIFIAIIAIQAAVACVLLLPSKLAAAEASRSAALTGLVSSQEEGPMEGVMVSAKREGSIVTVSVPTDAQGRYSFPRARLEPGRYSLRLRAVGYELSDPASVEVTAQKPARMDLKLVKAKDLASQLTNSEWLMSIPGTEKQKSDLMGCTGCHTLQRIFRTHYNTEEFAPIARRMGRYYEGSIPEAPQVLPAGSPGRPGEYGALSREEADFLTKVNLSSTPQWQYPLKTLPRLKGKSDRVIITEYDLPRKLVQPHDVEVDSKGMAWYCDNGHQFIGRLDPRTAGIKEFPIPVSRPGYPTGCRALYLDQAGSAWVSVEGQGVIAKFDPETEKFHLWNLSKEVDPDGYSLVISAQPQSVHVDHKLWVLSTGKLGTTIERLDVETGEWEAPIYVFKDLPKDNPVANRPQSIYEIFSDSNNNCYFTDFASEFIGKIDAKTRAVTFYQTPTFNSYPRRANMDKQDRLWFGEHGSNRMGMFDTRTAKFQEWEVPTQYSAPYDVVLDKDGYAWTGGMFTDRVVRLNTKTNEMVEYMLPQSTNIRRVTVDNTTSPPSLIVGSTHGYSIVRVEPLATLN